jgi:hypothetical protein
VNAQHKLPGLEDMSAGADLGSVAQVVRAHP